MSDIIDEKNDLFTRKLAVAPLKLLVMPNITELGDKIDRYLQVYRLYEDGKSAKEIACMMDLSLSWVYSIIETHYGCHGDDRPEAPLVFEGAKGGRFTDQEREWVFDKYMEGYTQDQIAEVTGRTQATISNAIQKVRRAHRK